MKSRRFAHIFAGCCLMGTVTFADPINLLANGNFDQSSPVNNFQTTFAGTSNWFNRGTGLQTSVARTNTLPLTGWNAVVNDRSTNATLPGAVIHSQKTEYQIQANDSFDLSYSWRDAAGWSANDVVRFVLFATDNDTLGGNVIWSSILDSGASTQLATWESVSQVSGFVNEAAVGRNLFVDFYGYDTSGTPSATTGFARVDDIVVSVVPEPATLALFALGMGALIQYRKRR